MTSHVESVVFSQTSNLDSKHKVNCQKSNESLLLPVALVYDAIHGFHSEYECNAKSLRLYFIYRNPLFNYALHFAIVFLHLVSIWESVGFGKDESNYHVTIPVEVICMSFLVSRLVLRAKIIPSQRFWRDHKNVIFVVTVCLMALDMFIYLCSPSQYAIRWSIALRPLFIVNLEENRQIRRSIRNIRDTLPDVINVLILFFLSLATFSTIALILFQRQNLFVVDNSQRYSRNETYFTNYGDIFFSLYVLVTTANNPDVTMPAYNANPWFALFFVVFLVVNLYLFMNIILAVIYNNYRKHLKEEVRNMLALKKDSLTRAFDALTDTVSNQSIIDSEIGLFLPQFRQLMDLYFSVSRSIFNSRKNEVLLVDVFWSLLAVDGKVKRKEFLQLAELFNMNISVICVDQSQQLLAHSFLTNIYESECSRKFRSVVKSKYFRYFFDGLILMNAIIITVLLERMKYLEWCLVAAFTLEILAKLYTFGFFLFIKKFWNIFDSFVIGSAIILWFLIELQAFPERNLQQYLDLMLILRILRLCKLIKSIERFNVIVKTIQALLPSIMTYGGLLFVVFYIYAIIGMQLFNGLYSGNANGCQKNSIHCCSQDGLRSSLQYCTINFNSFENALLFLFDLMVVNQWHILAKGPEIMLSSKWTRLYFISFHLLCVIIVLNIFTAFVLEAFILEYTSSTKGSSHSTILQSKLLEMGINCTDKTVASDFVDADHDNFSNDTGDNLRDRRFSIPRLHNSQNYKIVISEKKSVEVLLTRMFENELNNE